MRSSLTARSVAEHFTALLLLGGAVQGATARPVRNAVSQTEVRQHMPQCEPRELRRKCAFHMALRCNTDY